MTTSAGGVGWEAISMHAAISVDGGGEGVSRPCAILEIFGGWGPESMSCDKYILYITFFCVCTVEFGCFVP